MVDFQNRPGCGIEFLFFGEKLTLRHIWSIFAKLAKVGLLVKVFETRPLEKSVRQLLRHKMASPGYGGQFEFEVL